MTENEKIAFLEQLEVKDIYVPSLVAKNAAETHIKIKNILQKIAPTDEICPKKLARAATFYSEHSALAIVIKEQYKTLLKAA